MKPFCFDQPKRIPSTWNSSRLILRGPLTDKAIERYAKAGWYSEEFRQARRNLIAKKTTSLRREGNYVITPDGRLIYSPN